MFLACKVEEAHRKLSDVIAAAVAFKYGTENHSKEKGRVSDRETDTISGTKND